MTESNHTDLHKELDSALTLIVGRWKSLYPNCAKAKYTLPTGETLTYVRGRDTLGYFGTAGRAEVRFSRLLIDRKLAVIPAVSCLEDCVEDEHDRITEKNAKNSSAVQDFLNYAKQLSEV